MACTRSTSGNLLRRRCRGQQSQLMGSEDRARNRHERHSSRGGELDFAICHEFGKEKVETYSFAEKMQVQSHLRAPTGGSANGIPLKAR